MTRRALVLCPGRGSYGRTELGTLQGRPSAFLDAFDAHRAALGRPTVRELDAAERYSAKLHIAGEHASILTAGYTLSDVEAIDPGKLAVVGICGNSMGWYTALVAAGALDAADGATLVETMGAFQTGNVIGGQILYPVVDDDWRPDPRLQAVVDDAVADIEDLHWSIRLGGQAVLGGSDAALKAAGARLPALERGSARFPLKLPLHSAFHTPLLSGTREKAGPALDGLRWSTPRVPLVDGQGTVWPAGWADPAGIRAWTLGDQIDRCFDFSAMIEAALGELGPEVVVLPGPGSNLGGAVAQVMIRLGWQGIRSKADFLARQKADPIVLAMGRDDQRPMVVAG
jgi:acyl transferase domain-containing protein